MPRIAFHDKQEPIEVKEAGKFVCQCGLSKNFPFCDGSHMKTKDEEPHKVYQYVDGEQTVIGELHQHGEGCGCGDDCGCDDDKEDGCCKDGDGKKKDDCGCGHDH